MFWLVDITSVGDILHDFALGTHEQGVGSYDRDEYGSNRYHSN